MEVQPSRILTGLQPSGTLHIGNYFGAMRPLLNFTAQVDPRPTCYLMVADYHALTTLRDPEELRRNIYNVVKDYLAAGFDPAQVVLFRQSDNQDHFELSWILNCMVSVPFLMQAHSYKDKVNKGLDANAGLFTYPMLMAADITLYDIDTVPVGEDQRQHLEYTREAVTKLNNAFSTELLKEPKEHIMDTVGVVPGIDGQKMSKSYKNTVPLFGTEAETTQAVMKIVTDSEGSFPEHVYAIHRLIKTEEELAPIYENAAGRYGEIKSQLADDINTYFAEMRARRERITDAQVREVLADGLLRAKETSGVTLARVRDAIGITL